MMTESDMALIKVSISVIYLEQSFVAHMPAIKFIHETVIWSGTFWLFLYILQQKPWIYWAV